MRPIQPIGPGSKTIFCKLPRQNNRIYCHDSRSLFFIILFNQKTLYGALTLRFDLTCCSSFWEGATINYHLKKKKHKLIFFYFSYSTTLHCTCILFIKKYLINFCLLFVSILDKIYCCYRQNCCSVSNFRTHYWVN